MTRKRDKKTQQELERLEHERVLEKLREMENQRRQAYQEFVESAQSLKPLEKAEAWLDHIANDASTWDDYGGYGAEEAVVYLVSGGHDCVEHIKRIIAAWKLAERRSIERCMQGRAIYNLDTGETRKVGGMSYAEASDISNLSPYKLPNFWSGFDHQDLSIDATMLRTVEWCNIGSFDQWWLRLAKEHFEATTQGGVDPVPASFFLFSTCRSDYAIQLMHKTLIRLLEAIELPEHKQPYPWRRWRWTDPPQAVDHFAYAASIAFADERLGPHHSDTKLVNQALEALLKHQDIEGSWRGWADDKEPSVETTAMAIHALALKKPRGWELAASAARDWLWSVQDRSGCWVDPGCPDSIYLTVLVLDALELAEGGSKVTFGLSRPLIQPGEVRSMNRIRALFLTANPADTRKLNLDEQIRLITEKIRAADYRDLVELESIWAVRADDLLQSLNEHKPHIVHFSGHGSPTGEILVVGRDGQSKPISTKAIKALFKTLKDNIRIVILDACYSKLQAEAITEVIDCAIGMAGAIGEDAASVFTASFYRAIGFGRSIQEAFDQGITALLLEGIPEENTPKLLVKSGVDPSRLFLIGGGSQ
jgi:hypothetical protein